MLIPFRTDNPVLSVPWITFGLIVVNAVIWLTIGTVNGWIWHTDAPTAAGVLGSLFNHAGLFHVLGNLWVLWVVGRNVEEALGPARFLAFYLAAGLVAGAAEAALSPGVAMLGASGAIAGVMGFYTRIYPKVQVHGVVLLLWVQLVRMRAVWFFGAWFGLQILLSGGHGVAWWAHAGGFAFGYAVAPLARRGLPPVAQPVEIDDADPLARIAARRLARTRGSKQASRLRRRRGR